MQNTFGRLTWVAAVALSLSASPALGASLNSHYEVDLENYRACKVDANNHRLSSCTGNDVRSGSKFHLADGTQGSITVTNTGVVKARIDGLSWDVGSGSFACPNYDCDLTEGSPTQFRCISGPLAPNQPCNENSDCLGDICVGGPQDGLPCNPSNPDAVCRSLVGPTAEPIGYVVFGGVHPLITFPGGVAKFTLNGDNADAERGCTKICELYTNAAGKIDSNALTCEHKPAGCSVALEGYHVVQVLDFNKDVVAVPGVGTAAIVPTSFGVTDPARFGDVCRSGSPPADCAFDQ